MSNERQVLDYLHLTSVNIIRIFIVFNILFMCPLLILLLLCVFLCSKNMSFNFPLKICTKEIGSKYTSHVSTIPREKSIPTTYDKYK